MIGYAICGSYCTHSDSVERLRELCGAGYDLLPIISERAYSTDTRFGTARELIGTVEQICGRECIHTVCDAEPLGPKIKLDALIIAPCTGNTLAKLAHGITDSSVTMAAKAHLRCDRPLLIALASNDALSANLSNIAALLCRKNIYFLPMRQDDVVNKPHSLVADFSMLPSALSSALASKQLRPLFL